MTRHLAFAQRFGGLMQAAYVVRDIRESMLEWATKLNVGPWFLNEHFIGDQPVYRGRHVRADVSIAHSFVGSMNVELIQLNDTQPSIYKELVDLRGYGFHHWGFATSDFEAQVRRYESLGMEPVFHVGMPGGGRVAFIDTRGALPGFVELIQLTPVMERTFNGILCAAVCWDGSNPIRYAT